MTSWCKILWLPLSPSYYSSESLRGHLHHQGAGPEEIQARILILLTPDQCNAIELVSLSKLAVVVPNMFTLAQEVSLQRAALIASGIWHCSLDDLTYLAPKLKPFVQCLPKSEAKLKSSNTSP